MSTTINSLFPAVIIACNDAFLGYSVIEVTRQTHNDEFGIDIDFVYPLPRHTSDPYKDPNRTGGTFSLMNLNVIVPPRFIDCVEVPKWVLNMMA